MNIDMTHIPDGVSGNWKHTKSQQTAYIIEYQC